MGDTFDGKSTKRIVIAVKKIERISQPSQRSPKSTMVNTFFWGKIVANGPASESDYSDSRYHFLKVRLQNSDNSATLPFAFSEISESEPDYLHATAVNLTEFAGATHTVAMDSIVKVFPIRSANSKTIARYEFSY